MTVKLKGFNGIDRALRKLERTVRVDRMERALTDSAEPIEREYARGAPPAISRFTKTRTVEKLPHRVRVAVGTRHPLVHIFEFGTKRRATKAGAARGRIIKIGFARRAFDTRIGPWFHDLARRLWQEVRRAGR